MTPSDARTAIRTAIDRIGAAVAGACAWLGPELRLIVLPEYALTGFPLGETITQWRDTAAIAPDGPEFDALGAIAAKHGVYVAGNAYETDPHFPELFFQASHVIAPTGDVVLRYRRLHSLYSPTPYDVWDRYLDAYGIDGVLPVAHTEIGRLAAIASEEILYPELARALALRGAEIFCHSTSEISSPDLTAKAIARRARAVENQAFVVSANSGGLHGIAIPGDSTNGGSQIIDPEGRPLATAGPGESVVAAAELDVTTVRRARDRPGMANLLSRTKTGLWATEYARHDVERPNGLGHGETAERDWFTRRQRAGIERLHAAGELS